MNKKKLLIFFTLAIGISIVFLPVKKIFASHGTDAEAGGKSDSKDISSYDTFIVYENMSIKNKVKIYNVKMRYVNDILQISVTLTNYTKKPINIVYKFMWFDKDDFEVRANTSPWLPLSFQPKEQKTVQGVAPNPSAKSFKIKISIDN
uniref:DUF1425 domain-containing protein n=1 Tax=candidate division CPR3 bacterium TaxID=2268181 RepID=A0A7C5UR61_UNCC3